MYEWMWIRGGAVYEGVGAMGPVSGYETVTPGWLKRGHMSDVMTLRLSFLPHQAGQGQGAERPHVRLCPRRLLGHGYVHLPPYGFKHVCATQGMCGYSQFSVHVLHVLTCL